MLNASSAPLPAVYENAKVALAECQRIDECKDWADKAAALMSYTRQADDDTLFNMAKRIQMRAVRRMGELLKEFDARGAHRKTDGTVSSSQPSQSQAAADAGISERQQVTAVRIANVPDADFDAAVESDKPPTITALAEQGKKAQPKPAAPPASENVVDFVPDQAWNDATKIIGTLGRLAECCSDRTPEQIANGIRPHEIAEVFENIAVVQPWIDRLAKCLSNGKERVA